MLRCVITLAPFSGNAVQPAGALGKGACRVLVLILLAATTPVIVLIIPEISATQNPTPPMELRRSGPSGRRRELSPRTDINFEFHRRVPDGRRI